MPYIGISTSQTLTSEQKDALKTQLGEKISVVPGKSEERLMVDISDGRAMYFAGQKKDLAYLDVKCYGAVDFEYQKAFTEAAFQCVEKITGLPKDCIYLTFGEFMHWGTLGSLK